MKQNIVSNHVIDVIPDFLNSSQAYNQRRRKYIIPQFFLITLLELVCLLLKEMVQKDYEKGVFLKEYEYI